MAPHPRRRHSSTETFLQKDQSLLPSKRRPHFQTHKRSWHEQKFGHVSQRGPKLRITVLATPTSNCWTALTCTWCSLPFQPIYWAATMVECTIKQRRSVIQFIWPQSVTINAIYGRMFFSLRANINLWMGGTLQSGVEDWKRIKRPKVTKNINQRAWENWRSSNENVTSSGKSSTMSWCQIKKILFL
jgi:hypothetical protein